MLNLPFDLEFMKTLFSTISQYLSLVTFAHTIFAMPFALVGFFLATAYDGYPFKWSLLILVLLCMIFARNAAMGFNRYVDRKIDAMNPRTAQREIPAGVISPKAGLIFILINVFAFVATCYFINPLCLYLSPLALLVILGYSLTKHFTAFCHLILGLGLSIAPIGAYLAVSGAFSWLPLVYAGVVLSWVAGFDIIYAMQDRQFDQKHQLHSIPVTLGGRSALALSVVIHLITATLVILAGYWAGFSWFYFIGTACFIGLLIYQHLLVKPDDLRKVNRAFGTTNGIASVVFATFFLLEVLL